MTPVAPTAGVLNGLMMVMMSRRLAVVAVVGLAALALGVGGVGGCVHHGRGHARVERTVYYDDYHPGYYHREATVYRYDTFGYAPGYRGYSGRRYDRGPDRVVVVDQEGPRERITRDRERRVYGGSNDRPSASSPPRAPRSTPSTGDRGDRYSRDTPRGGSRTDRRRTRD